MPVAIREARLPAERSTLVGYIHDLQLFEAAFEADRRTDAAVASLYFDQLVQRVQAQDGRIFVAEHTGLPGHLPRIAGWAVCHTNEHPVFVKESERRFGYIAELFVEEGLRGQHIGRALIQSCEAHFRQRGLPYAMIGLLAGNARAIKAYQAAGYAPYSMELRRRL